MCDACTDCPNSSSIAVEFGCSPHTSLVVRNARRAVRLIFPAACCRIRCVPVCRMWRGVWRMRRHPETFLDNPALAGGTEMSGSSPITQTVRTAHMYVCSSKRAFSVAAAQLLCLL